MSRPTPFVFHDPEGKRWARFRQALRVILLLCGLAMACLLHGFFAPSETTGLTRIIAGWSGSVWELADRAFWFLLSLTTFLLVARGILVLTLASLEYHRANQRAAPTYHPPASILIAAYNEEKVLRATLRSVLNTEYPGELEIVVVDDGSTDATSRVVETAAEGEPRIRLIRQANGGKSTALRTAVAAARHEVLIFLDADTHFQPDTLPHLVQPLADPAVGAVSGYVKVGNPRNFLTRCQALEYACGFNLDRRAYALWNCITVVPGAVSAIRRAALDAAGGFSVDTLAEDTDLTLCLHKRGYRIESAPAAIAWTEAPETLSTLARQRLRWAFGTLQCLCKHRDLTLNSAYPALGWFSLPSVWFCQIFLVALMPMVDLLLLHAVFTREAVELLWYLAAFLVYDFALALYACVLDGEPLRKAWRILPMRIFYRPLLSWVVLRSLLKAARGAWVAWDKLERSAGVEQARPSMT